MNAVNEVNVNGTAARDAVPRIRAAIAAWKERKAREKPRS